MKKSIKKVLTVLAVSAVSAVTLMVTGCNGSANDWIQEKIDQLNCEHATTKLIEAVAPTCTEKGSTEGVECVDCGKVITKPDTINAKGHSLIHYEELEATCLLSGLTEGEYCAVCDTWVKERKEIKATGHKVVELKGVAPTCTETGLGVGQGCEYCGEVYVAQEVLPITDHKFNINGECITCGYTVIKGTDLKVGDNLEGFAIRLTVTPEEYVETLSKLAEYGGHFSIEMAGGETGGNTDRVVIDSSISPGDGSIKITHHTEPVGGEVNATSGVLVNANGYVVGENATLDDGQSWFHGRLSTTSETAWVVTAILSDELFLSMIEFYKEV